MIKRPFITVAVQCHNFQRRLLWMLSSLAEQTDPGLVEIDVAHVAGNGTPTCEALADRFAGRVNVRLSTWEGVERFQYRGIVRNRQMQECATEWLMFGDSDMVYRPEYFARLAEELRQSHAEASYMLSSGRISNPKDQAKALVDAYVSPELSVPHPWALADRLPKIRKGNIGAGFCQMINMRHCPHGGYYVKPNENRDRGFKRGWNTKSDMNFRKRIKLAGGGRRSLPDWFTHGAIHLNHERDPEHGRHLEDQR